MSDNELFILGQKLPMPLPKQETYELLEKISQGDEQAKEKLIYHNIRLVLYLVTTHFKMVKYDKKDLVSIGNLGLMKAVTTFDVSKKVEFATYATRCINNEILMFLRRIKKDQIVDSLDHAVFYGKDGDELKIEDKLSDDMNLVEEYIKNETYEIIRQFVNTLPARDREIIMLHFGFYNNKIYTQKEIADRLCISPSYVSRLVKNAVEVLAKKLNRAGVIELETKEELCERKEPDRKIKTIYELFDSYTKEQVDAMLEKLTEEDKALIKLRYGEDLNNPVYTKLSKEESNKFYGILLIKMRRLLPNPKGKAKIKTIYEHFDSYTKEEVDTMLEKLTEEDKALIKLRYGEDLNNPVYTKLSKEETDKFYNVLLYKMKKLLSDPMQEQKKVGRKIKTIYEHFDSYTKEQVDAMLEKLTEEDKALIKLRYGEDLNNPVYTKLSKEESNKFYGILRHKMRKLLANSNEEIEIKTKILIPNEKVTSTQEITLLNLKSEEILEIKNVDAITKNDYIKILKLLRTQEFSKMMNRYSPKELIIAYLKLGYIDGKCFSTLEISEFLGIEQQEVIDTTVKFLTKQKVGLNQIIGNSTQISTEDSETTQISFNKTLNKTVYDK